MIDDIYYQDPSIVPYLNVLGGAGTFAAVGARLFLSTNDAKNVGLIVHEGGDFPIAVRNEIDSWGLGVKYIATPERNTTRGRNFYSQDNVKGKLQGHRTACMKLTVSFQSSNSWSQMCASTKVCWTIASLPLGCSIL